MRERRGERRGRLEAREARGSSELGNSTTFLFRMDFHEMLHFLEIQATLVRSTEWLLGYLFYAPGVQKERERGRGGERKEEGLTNSSSPNRLP
jgi:hypothetical protein